MKGKKQKERTIKLSGTKSQSRIERNILHSTTPIIPLHSHPYPNSTKNPNSGEDLDRYKGKAMKVSKLEEQKSLNSLFESSNDDSLIIPILSKDKVKMSIKQLKQNKQNNKRHIIEMYQKRGGMEYKDNKDNKDKDNNCNNNNIEECNMKREEIKKMLGVGMERNKRYNGGLRGVRKESMGVYNRTFDKGSNFLLSSREGRRLTSACGIRGGECSRESNIYDPESNIYEGRKKEIVNYSTLQAKLLSLHVSHLPHPHNILHTQGTQDNQGNSKGNSKGDSKSNSKRRESPPRVKYMQSVPNSPSRKDSPPQMLHSLTPRSEWNVGENSGIDDGNLGGGVTCKRIYLPSPTTQGECRDSPQRVSSQTKGEVMPLYIALIQPYKHNLLSTHRQCNTTGSRGHLLSQPLHPMPTKYYNRNNRNKNNNRLGYKKQGNPQSAGGHSSMCSVPGLSALVSAHISAPVSAHISAPVSAHISAPVSAPVSPPLSPHTTIVLRPTPPRDIVEDIAIDHPQTDHRRLRNTTTTLELKTIFGNPSCKYKHKASNKHSMADSYKEYIRTYPLKEKRSYTPGQNKNLISLLTPQDRKRKNAQIPGDRVVTEILGNGKLRYFFAVQARQNKKDKLHKGYCLSSQYYERNYLSANDIKYADRLSGKLYLNDLYKDIPNNQLQFPHSHSQSQFFHGRGLTTADLPYRIDQISDIGDDDMYPPIINSPKSLLEKYTTWKQNNSIKNHYLSEYIDRKIYIYSIYTYLGKIGKEFGNSLDTYTQSKIPIEN